MRKYIPQFLITAAAIALVVGITYLFAFHYANYIDTGRVHCVVNLCAESYRLMTLNDRFITWQWLASVFTCCTCIVSYLVACFRHSDAKRLAAAAKQLEEAQAALRDTKDKYPPSYALSE